MKKMLFCAAAAIAVLASCSKTQVVYNDAPEEIAFKQITGVMTKADGDALPTSMGVYAYLVPDATTPELSEGETTTENSYFNNIEFTGNDGVYTGGQYWPVSGELKFTVYAPFFSNESNRVSYRENKLTFSVTNDQTDWLYGTTQPTGSKTDKDNVTVTLAHALSKIVVNVNGDSNVKIKKIELLNAAFIGLCSITYAGNQAGQPDFSNPGEIIPYSLYVATQSGGTALSAENLQDVPYCLVIPQSSLSDQAIRLTYTFNGSDTDLTYTTTPAQIGNTWMSGSKYTYNFTIGAEEIKFQPIVSAWVTDDDENTEGNNTTGIEVTPNTQGAVWEE